MSVCAELTKKQRKQNFDTNPDPEWFSICHMCSNTKRSFVSFVWYYWFGIIGNLVIKCAIPCYKVVTRYRTLYLVNNKES